MSGFLDPKSPGSPEDQPNGDPPERDSGDHPDQLHQQWREVFEASLPGLRAFLRGRLTQPSDIEDCLQVVTVQMIEKGSSVAPAARRAWLFRVAANESARIWRSRASTDKAFKRYASDNATDVSPDEIATQNETKQRLQRAVESLPPAWQRVVHLRIHQNLTFQQIADQLDIPLGTALTQMRRALQRLREEIGEPDNHDNK